MEKTYTIVDVMSTDYTVKDGEIKFISRGNSSDDSAIEFGTPTLFDEGFIEIILFILDKVIRRNCEQRNFYI